MPPCVLGDAGTQDDQPEGPPRARGRDTRVSGDFLASALSAGMAAGGFDVIDAGIIPTPGIAFLTSVINVELGAVISDSHHPMPDNGIKFFARRLPSCPTRRKTTSRPCSARTGDRRPVPAWAA